MHGVATKCVANGVDLMGDDNEDERGDDHIEHWVTRYKNQDTMGVGCHPDMILTNEKLVENKNRFLNIKTFK